MARGYGRRPALTCAALVALLAVTGCGPAGQTGPIAPTGPRASELYAADGHTLVARFDDGDPHASCLAVPVNEWGFYCDYLVSWWAAQPAFGGDAAQRLDRLRHGGYRITGSLDVKLEKAAVSRVEAQRPTGGPGLLTVLSLQPGTGRIRAMATNRKFAASAQPSPTGPYSPVVDYPQTTAAVFSGEPGLQAPGSTYMMFTVVAALEKGIPLGHLIDTQRRYVSGFALDARNPAACQGPHYCPTAAPDDPLGPRTMWEALSHRMTTYFVPLEEQVGADAVVDVAKRLGITFPGQADAALLARNGKDWGSFTLGVVGTSTLDLADAYATLGADGVHCDPLPVAGIAGTDGRPVPGGEPHCTSVLRPDVARAALDAGRCPVGDRSAFGDVCGAPGPAAEVRALVGQPVAGQLGLLPGDFRNTSALVVVDPQVVTAGFDTDSPRCAGCDRPGPADIAATVRAVAGTQHDALAGLSSVDIPAPPASLARG